MQFCTLFWVFSILFSMQAYHTVESIISYHPKNVFHEDHHINVRPPHENMARRHFMQLDSFHFHPSPTPSLVASLSPSSVICSHSWAWRSSKELILQQVLSRLMLLHIWKIPAPASNQNKYFQNHLQLLVKVFQGSAFIYNRKIYFATFLKRYANLVHRLNP